jgi:sporulation protein YtfJ
VRAHRGADGMAEHPIQGLMKTAMESIKGMIDVNTVVGQAVHTADGTVVVPVSCVSFGFAAGGTEFGRAEARRGEEATHPFGGGSGAGVSVRPVGFLVVTRDAVRLLPVDERAAIERLVDVVPELIERVQGIFAGRDGRRDGRRVDRAAEAVERAGLSLPTE